MKQKKTSGRKRLFIRIGFVLLGLVALMALAVSIVLHTVVSPKKITPIVLNWANENLDALVSCESIDVTFFSTFPQLGVRFQDGSIVKKMNIGEDSTYLGLSDTLISFHSFTASFDPVEFLFNKKLIINKLSLDHPDIYAFVDPDGVANWDIMKSESDSDTITSGFQRPQLDVKDISIIGADIIYEDLSSDVFIKVDNLQLKLSGNMSEDSTGLDLKLGMEALTSHYGEQLLSDRLPLDIEARLKNNRIEHRLSIEQAQFSVGVLSFDAEGIIQRDEKTRLGQVDMDFRLSASSLSELLSAVPDHISDVKNKLITTGKIESQGSLKGFLGNGNYPVLEMSVNLKDGSLRSAKYKDKSGLKKIEIACSTKIDFSEEQPSFLNIERLYLKSASSEIGISGEVTEIFTKPFVNAHLTGNIDFNRLSQDFSFVKGVKMGGNINLDLSAKCFADEILASDYGKLDANGKISVENVFYKDTVNSISFLASGGNIRLGSNVTDTIRGQVRESLLRGGIALDSINLDWKNEIHSSAGRVAGWFGTSAPKDTTSMATVSGGVRLENMRLIMGDSIMMKIIKANAILRLTPQETDPSKPEFTFGVTLDSLMGKFLTMGGRVNSAKLSLKIKKQESGTNHISHFRRPGIERDSIRANFTAADSMRFVNRRDSLQRINRKNNLSFRLESSEAKDALRHLDISGSFECKNMSLRTPYFPLPVRMTQSSLKFTTNTLSLSEVNLKIGSSDMSLKGEIEGIRSALLFDGKVTAKLSMNADSVNFNELIKAAVDGSGFVEKSTVQQDSISQVVLDESKEITSVITDTVASGIFVVPGNIDIEFDTKMNETIYGKLRLDNTSGKIIIRDRAVHLPDLKINSDLGSARVSLVYKAANRQGAHFGMDLGMRQVNVKALIDAFPMIDTLTPMLRSFEGVVDCDMTVLTEMDSLMNIRLPETTAACYMHGVNMVLLDGETFAEISKMLMFKNKKRNMIDSISVEMILENSKVMIFPFLVSLDRYQAGVGGTQNLDMTFDYHITVLKSPLPFKLGLNVTGSPDKMKIRLAKAKYKNLFTPAKEQDLAGTEINLRQEMDKKLKKSIEDIIRQPATHELRRPGTGLPDSLLRSFFQLDTTKVDYPQVEEQSDSIVSPAE
ncbi:MAG: hypothetical protein LBJ72_05315 [Dysgonamonadaceae bacterium]|nr:hypothetical protein [Dysgonamonadaceae bacterium]